jgi:hypothetical protein
MPPLRFRIRNDREIHQNNIDDSLTFTDLLDQVNAAFPPGGLTEVSVDGEEVPLTDPVIDWNFDSIVFTFDGGVPPPKGDPGPSALIGSG